MRNILPGDKVYYRDDWNIPTQVVVDYWEFSQTFERVVVGKNSRGSQVRLGLSELYRRIECDVKLVFFLQRNRDDAVAALTNL